MKTTKTGFSLASIFVFILFLSFNLSLHSQTSTIFSGNWSNNSNWDNNVPLSNSTAFINHDMNMDVNLSINNENYTINGTGSLSSTTANTIQVSGSGIFDVKGSVNILGDFFLSNTATLYVRSNDTMIVGNAEFRNSAVVIIEAFAVMIVNGDLDLRNNNNTTLDGNLYVNGNVTARNSSTIVGTGNLEATGEVDLTNNTIFFGNTTPCSPGPCEYGSGGGLPIQLTRFEANHQPNGQVQLEWVTQTELNNDYFIVEKSMDGFFFEKIAMVDGAGSSIERTEYSILTPAESEVTYFRLSQVDFDGASKSFNAIAVMPNRISNDQELFQVFPSPVQSGNLLHMTFQNELDNAKIQIRELNGKIISEENISGFYTEIFIDEDLNSGLYFISLITNDAIINKKLVIGQ